MIADEILNYEIKEPNSSSPIWSNFERKTISQEELTKKTRKDCIPGADSNQTTHDVHVSQKKKKQGSHVR